jgi:peptidoglycan/LPS O-acetylase OafA/YrhL
MSTKQMIFMLTGAVSGLAAGALALLLVFRRWGESIEDTPVLVLVIVAGLVVGGLVAGAYGAQAIIYRKERSKKKQRRAEKSERKEKRRR